VAKEIFIRKKLSKIFNSKEDDFSSLREYNDYLEKLEFYVFNLTNEIDVDETKKSIDEFQRRNEESIQKNKNRRTKDDEWIQRMLYEEEIRKRNHFDAMQSANSSAEPKKERKGEDEMRALMAEFMSSDIPAEFIVNDKKRQQYLAKQAADQEKQEQKNQQNRPKNQSIADQKQQIVPLSAISDGEPYIYEEISIDLNGPPIPKMEELGSLGYLKHIRAASVGQLAGGYHESLGCYRALTEAHCDLFWTFFVSIGRFFGIG